MRTGDGGEEATDFTDERDLLLLRLGWGVSQISEPFNWHPTMAPEFVFKSLQEVSGRAGTSFRWQSSSS